MLNKLVIAQLPEETQRLSSQSNSSSTSSGSDTTTINNNNNTTSSTTTTKSSDKLSQADSGCSADSVCGDSATNSSCLISDDVAEGTVISERL